MAKAVVDSEFDVDALSADVTRRFDDVPWSLFDSKDLASSGETRYAASRIQADLLKVAAIDPSRAARIWDEHVPGYVPRPSELPGTDRDIEPVNAIEPGRRRRKPVTEPFLDTVSGRQSETGREERGKSQAPDPTEHSPRQADGVQGKQQAVEDPDAARIRLLTDGLNKQYLKADDKYHFRDRGGDVAFEVQQTKLVTQHDTPSVVSSMIDLAETRGWSTLRLTGTQEFRREAWLQANLRDFEVSGYRPTKLDKVKLEELRAGRAAQSRTNNIERVGQKVDPAPPSFAPLLDEGTPEPKISLTPGQDQFLRVMEATMRHRGDAPVAIERARELANERLTSDRIYVGKLVEVGTAPYLDKRGEKLSHFVTLKDDVGAKSKVWGADLPRALGAAGAEPGQLIAVAFAGRRPVSVDVPIKDEAGKILRTEKRDVERNAWDIVPFDRLRDDAKASVLNAVRRQQNPAELKVFDRSVAPSVTRLEVKSRHEKSRERSV